MDVTPRPLGEPADLDVDFASDDRPGLVTALLALCGAPRDAAYWWAQPVSNRTRALLDLVVLNDARDELALVARCTRPACAEPLEFELPIAALPDGAAAPMRLRLGDAREAVLRPATGEDLRRWRAARPRTRDDAVRAMLAALLVEGDVRLDEQAAVSEAIAALDPLVDFSVACRCPGCGADNEIVVDLESLALARLARRQRQLVQEVHRFAANYGWTERDVLALPPARRARYLALIDADAGVLS